MTERENQDAAIRQALQADWVALGLAVLYVLALLASGWSLSRARAALVRHGRPMTFAELAPASLPAVDNAALLYNAATQLLKATPWQPDPAQPARPLMEVANAAAKEWFGGSVSPEAADALAAPFRDPALAMAIALVEQGNARPGCRFDFDDKPSGGAAPLDLIALLDLERILAGRALLAARDGRGREAWQTIITGLGLARALQPVPTLLSHAVLTAQTALFLDVAAQVQNQTPLDAATNQALVAAIGALDGPTSMAAAMDGERLFLSERVFAGEKRLRARDLMSDRGWLRVGMARVGWWLYLSRLALPLWQWDHACCLRVTDEAAAAMLRPYDQADRKLSEDLRRSVPRFCLVTRRLLPPNLGSVKDRQVTHLARVRLARAGLALQAARSAAGGFPKDLSSLTAAGIDVTDPFTGRPFAYRTTADGFLLYSLGRDQRDDQGTPWNADAARKSQEKPGWDLVWSFPPRAGLTESVYWPKGGSARAVSK
jgi:type II secretory pathway pseudopilin PulG